VRGLQASLTDAEDQTTSYNYDDAAGRVSLLIYPDASEVSRGYFHRKQQFVTVSVSAVVLAYLDHAGFRKQVVQRSPLRIAKHPTRIDK
jgi:hypothetical protein